jgi:hypothetical protein
VPDPSGDAGSESGRVHDTTPRTRTYGLHNFWLDEKTGYLHLDYDASRLKEIVVEHVLRGARIAVLRKLEPGNN